MSEQTTPGTGGGTLTLRRRLPALALTVGVTALVAWNVWLTGELRDLQARRTVAVSLDTIVKEFVAESAKAGLSPEAATARTAAFSAALEETLAVLNDGRTTVVVAEAVLGQTVPDVTEPVRQAVAARLERQTARAPGATAASRGGGDGAK